MLPDYTKDIYHKPHAVQGNGSVGHVLESGLAVRLSSENGLATFLGETEQQLSQAWPWKYILLLPRTIKTISILFPTHMRPLDICNK